MKCLIVDDNEIARIAMRGLASQVPFLEVVGECANALETANFLAEKSVDLLLLDVEMPDLTGLELLRTLSNPPLVILVTSKKEYAFDAFEQNVVDYLAKPVGLARFLKAVHLAKEVFEARQPQQILGSPEKGDGIFVRSNSSLLKIPFAEILYVQAMGDYVIFQLEGKKHAIHSTLKQVEERLPAEKFQRIHRSHIVALDKIKAVEEGSRVVVNDKYLPIAEGYKAALLERLNLL